MSAEVYNGDCAQCGGPILKHRHHMEEDGRLDRLVKRNLGVAA